MLLSQSVCIHFQLNFKLTKDSTVQRYRYWSGVDYKWAADFILKKLLIKIELILTI